MCNGKTTYMGVLKILIPTLPKMHLDDYTALFEYLRDTLNIVNDSNIDYNKDYRIIWDAFKSERGIDLNKDDLHWWEFNTILECLVYLDNGNSLTKMLEYRTYTKPPKKGGEERHHQFMVRMRRKYALKANLSIGISSMMNYFKGVKK